MINMLKRSRLGNVARRIKRRLLSLKGNKLSPAAAAPDVVDVVAAVPNVDVVSDLPDVDAELNIFESNGTWESVGPRLLDFASNSPDQLHGFVDYTLDHTPHVAT